MLKIPKSVIATFVALFSILGSYAIENSMVDIAVMFGATALALLFQALRISILPIVLAVILGPLLEQQALVLATTYNSVSSVLSRPIADGFFLISLGIITFSVIGRLRRHWATAAR